MAYKLHILQVVGKRDQYRLGFWQDRPDRNEAARIEELNSQFAEYSGAGKTFTAHSVGFAAYPDRKTASQAWGRAKDRLKRRGATFGSYPTIFRYPAGNPTL